MAGFFDLLEAWPEFLRLTQGIGSGCRRSLAYGLEGPARDLVAAAVGRSLGRTILLVTAGPEEAERAQLDLSAWLGPAEVAAFPAREVFPYEVLASSPEILGQRLAILARLLGEPRPRAVVVPVTALFSRLPPPSLARGLCLELKVGAEAGLDAACDLLVRAGYQRVGLVEAPGQFARRGGILDVFPLTGQDSIRAEFAGDRVESLRGLDPGTQRSQGLLESASLPPAAEFLLPQAGWEQGLAAVRRDLETAAAALRRSGRPADAARLEARVEAHLERLGQGGPLDGLDLYAAYFHPPADLLDYLPPDLLVVVDDPGRVAESARSAEADLTERFKAYLEQGQALPGQAGHPTAAQVWGRLETHPTLGLAAFLRQPEGAGPEVLVSLSSRPVPAFQGQWRLFVGELRRWLDQGRKVGVLASTPDRARRLGSSLGEEDLLAPVLDEVSGLGRDPLALAVGELSAGFELPAVGLVFLTDGEILARPKRRRRPAPRVGRPLAAYQDLRVGDYVVHANHGVGRYLGIKTLAIEGVERDYLFLKYAGADRLYVPTDQIDLIQKYVGPESHEPRLNRLGGVEWSRARHRVKESVQAMARELLRLYATRQAVTGFDFGPDAPWQREFEDAFAYEETPDQARATEEIKRDMEQPRPMERLLCGDVGYGKTEVALRAAFKAILGGKQVAILVPTTILAHQHYRTCRERFAGYPVETEMLSRFRTPQESKDVLGRLAAGKIDLVAGTHRLLQRDVRFKDLGLLIVDEEQRFGVADKEKLKKLRENVDVLTMSATPIPRTLHMSLAGLRDMSVIETPPEDRYPVQTYVVEFNPDLVREAIHRELGRGGQVYYVHNQVETIDHAHRRLARLVPDARVVVAHGQMREDRLERVMLDFLARRSDVLLCTTIIESGLDIANVNTLVVEEADRFGLSQLYQLRGRVGRSNRLAYAYFTYRRDKVLSESAEKRLQAIREFTELGSGFKVAMRDLEIRGAGNLLGPEQHGFVTAIGFDLYCQLLEEAVRELKGEAPPPRPAPPVVELGLDAYLPEAYVADPRQKIEFYKRLAAAETPAEVDEAEEDLRDRCGPIPAPAQNLLRVARLRVRASRLGVGSLAQVEGRLVIRFVPDAHVPAARLAEWAGRAPFRVKVGSGRVPALTLGGAGRGGPKALEALERVLGEWEGFWG